MTDLPQPVIEWIGQTGGGTVLRLERAVARREAWLVDIAHADGFTLPCFFRIERERHPDDPSSLAKEAAIVSALQATDVPVARLYGSDSALGVALFERLDGRADLPNVPEAQQHAVMRHFIDVIACLHRLDPATLDMPDLPLPSSPAECALAEVDRLVRRHADYLARGYDPLLRYGIAWLRRQAPERVSRISLVQGDTGPVNFMFQGDRVSAVFDWEWGHLGDPIEDLGNIATREFWNPSGGMTGLLDRYRAATGFDVDRFRVRYYCVQQQIRGMIGIHRATETPSPHEPITWYLAYRYIGDRATCEALAEAMDVPVSPPSMPVEDGRSDPLADAAVHALETDIAVAASGALSVRVRDVAILVRCMERVARYGREVDALERADAEALLGIRFDTLAAALAAVNEAVDDGRIDDRRLIGFFHHRAARREWLYAPCAALYPNRRWSPL